MTIYHETNPYDLVLLLGDNIYETGDISKVVEHFEKPFKSLLDKGIKFRAALGNHDIYNIHLGGDEVKYSKFNMDGYYYSYVKNNVAFFVINTNLLDSK